MRRRGHGRGHRNWRKLALALAVAAAPALAVAHSCHDFTRRRPRPRPTSGGTDQDNGRSSVVASQDDIILKVNVQNGQLHIGEESAFRVYLFNTSDAEVPNVGLAVQTGGFFDAEVKPAGDWQGFPLLKPLSKGGRKEYFDVALKRRPGVPDGKYQLGLVLFDSKDRRNVYKRVDVAQAADLVSLPRRSAEIKIDGRAESSEWSGAYLCDGFYAYVDAKLNGKKCRRNVPAGTLPSRIRLTWDDEHIYCMFQCSGAWGAEADELTMYVAPSEASASAEVVQLTFDRLAGKVTCTGAQGVEVKADQYSKDRAECRIPRQLLGIKDAEGFRLNFSRKVDFKDPATGKPRTLVTYWRGNSYSLLSPLVYCQFTLAER